MNEVEAAAVAAWDRFESEVRDELLHAVAGAFALVACADGEVAEAEVERFVALTHQDAFRRLELARLEPAFRDLTKAMLADFAEGKRLALEAVSAVKDDASAAELTVSAAQIAIVADHRLKASEEAVLAEICQALEIDPESR